MSDIPADWRGQLDLRAAVYAIRCARTARVYVGSSNRTKQRWAAHRSDLKRGKHNNQKLQRSYMKYGGENLVFEILEIIDCLDSLRAREQFWIEALHAACKRRGFNLLPTAGSPLGHKHTAATRAKMSAAKIGKSPSVEHRAALSAARKGLPGRPLSPEAKERLRTANLGHGRVPTAEARARMSAAKLGKPTGRVFTYEQRQRMRAKALLRKHSEATKEKIRLIRLGKPLSPEQCAAMSKSRKGIPLSEAHKKAIGAAQKLRLSNAKTSMV